jgi:hypothetical protein
MLSLSENRKKKELNTIINIVISNDYKENDILILYNWFKHKQNHNRKNSVKDKKMGLYSPTLEITYVKSSCLRIQT